MKFFKKGLAVLLAAITVFGANTVGVFAATVNEGEAEYRVPYSPDEHGSFLSEDEVDNSVSLYGNYISKTEYEKIIRNDNSLGANYSASFYGCYDTGGGRIKYVSSVDGVHAVGTNMNSISINGQKAYCIQPGVHTSEWVSYSDTSTGAWQNLTRYQRQAINTVLCYGREGNLSNLQKGTTINSDQAWCATQILIWEIVRGVRNATAPYSLKSGQNGYIGLTCANGANPNIRTAYNKIVNGMASYQKKPTFAETDVSKAPTYYLKAVYNASTRKWNYESMTLTDNNNVLSQFSQFNGKTLNVGNGTVKVSVSGNRLILTPLSADLSKASQVATISSVKSGIPKSSKGTLVSYAASGYQDIISGGVIDPPSAFFKVGITTSELARLDRDGRIQKVVLTPSENDDPDIDDDEGSLSTSDNVEGWYFRVIAPDSFTEQYGVTEFTLGPTDKSGFTQSLSEYVKSHFNYNNVYTIVPAGYYYFYELGQKQADGSISMPDFYADPQRFTLYLASGITLNGIGYAHNIFNIPTVLYKVNEDGSSTENYVFEATNKETGETYRISSLGENGCKVIGRNTNKYNKVVDGNHYILLPEGSYTIKELGVRQTDGEYKIPDRFETPDIPDFEVSAEAYKTAQDNGDKAITISVKNQCSGYIAVQKSETGNPDKRVQGAVYGVFSDEACLELMYEMPPTDQNGESTSEIKFACNTKLYVKEIEAPPNYELDETVYPVMLEPNETSTSEIIKYTCKVSDLKIVSGSVTLKKTNNKSEPLTGTEWRILTLQREPLNFEQVEQGQYEYSEQTENPQAVNTLKTNSQGVMKCTKLPLGDYYMIEVKAADNYMPYGLEIPFTISDSSDETLNVLLNAENHYSFLNETGGNGNYLNYFYAGLLAIPTLFGLLKIKKIKKKGK